MYLAHHRHKLSRIEFTPIPSVLSTQQFTALNNLISFSARPLPESMFWIKSLLAALIAKVLFSLDNPSVAN
jgi:hypothetical protein